ncbi:choice-of-anchor P family protein [Nocardioides sp. HM23]|nr:choice-of-anchor P family protein [Nocardioides sp. HM23]MDZ5621357.1 choice-of-anchor P family protein [Nocardioides sp. HM23]
MRKFATIVAFGLVGASFVAVPTPTAQAADVTYSYAARTGGTYAKVFDGTVSSDLTAESSVTGGPDSVTSSNSTAAVNVQGLLRVGAVETETKATVGAASTTLNSFARTANVNLLNGLIKVDAVTTNITTVARADGSASSAGQSQLLGIGIVGVDLPVRIPKNYAVTIPGVASITLNVHLHASSDEAVATNGWAIGITLLKPRAGYAAGVTVMVNPVNQFLSEAVPATGAKLFGQAYGTRVKAHVGEAAQIISDPTARVSAPSGSSHGRTIQNQTLGVRVPGLLTTGVVTSTTNSTKDDAGNAEMRNTNEIARLNVLGGLIRAEALKVLAYGKVQGGKWTSRMRMTFVNLVIAGQKIPIDVGRNTVIDVAGLGEVAINLQQKNPNGARQNLINGIRITLDTERAGLPIGAVIEIGVAGTFII